jgi:deazaflavin-dependent oxidoreductase (nitroreductase family)
VLLLTTTGRKSGRTRTRPLPYDQDGDAFVVIASNGGNKKHPDWYLNLNSNPNADIETRNGKQRVRASIASGAERERLWARALERYAGYDGYQAETDRQIPVVILRPMAGASESAP